jgi:hypothetical protein
MKPWNVRRRLLVLVTNPSEIQRWISQNFVTFLGNHKYYSQEQNLLWKLRSSDIWHHAVWERGKKVSRETCCLPLQGMSKCGNLGHWKGHCPQFCYVQAQSRFFFCYRYIYSFSSPTRPVTSLTIYMAVSSKLLVRIYQAIRHYIPNDHNLHTSCLANLRSHKGHLNFHIVTCQGIARQRLDKVCIVLTQQQNSEVMQPISGQRLGKHTSV